MSGIQPTGDLHLGNYLGALRNFAGFETNSSDCYFCIADLHAITVKHDPAMLRQNVRLIAAAMLATGIDHRRSKIFVQSAVPAHAELAWLFNCVARMGWMERMPQFKDKAGQDAERASVGLFTYPILQAADILLYKATEVPVGIDQVHHLELAGEIARKFNHDFNTDLFPHPKPMIVKNTKIMSLLDGSKKMSKSDPNDNSRINMMDAPELIAKKIKKATAATEPLPFEVEEGYPNASVENLVNIYALIEESCPQAVLDDFGGKGYGIFKTALADLLIAKLTPLATDMKQTLADPGSLDAILGYGNLMANNKAYETLCETKEVLGLWNKESMRR